MEEKKKKKGIKITKGFFLENAIDKIDLKDKTVFLRADLNIPVDLFRNKILSPCKLENLLPTLNLLLEKGARIILATHIGQPTSCPSYTQNYQEHNTEKKDNGYANTLETWPSSTNPEAGPWISTKILLDFFKNQPKNYDIVFEPDLDKVAENKTNKIILLENLRCFDGEKIEKVAKKFARKLRKMSDFYVNEAFGTIHRNDTSVTILPKMFKRRQIFLGLQASNEIKMLNKLLNKPKEGFTAIFGGAKVETKLPLIEKILDKIDNLLLCPAIDFPFMKYFDDHIGKSLLNKDMIPYAARIIEKARQKNVKIFYPEDFIAAKDTFDGDVYDVDKPDIPENFIGVSIGPKTAKNYAKIIRDSKTVFFSGLSGNIKRPESLEGMKRVFKAMGKRGLFSVIGGGESVAVANLLGTNEVKHLSLGGGAALAFFAEEELPGLAPFMKKTKIKILK